MGRGPGFWAGRGVLGPSPAERPALFNQLFFIHAPRGRSCSAAAISLALACPCRPMCGLLRCLSHSPRRNSPYWPPPLCTRPLAARCESPPLPLPVRLPSLSFVWLFLPSCHHVPECHTTRVRPARVGWRRWWWHRQGRFMNLETPKKAVHLPREPGL